MPEDEEVPQDVAPEPVPELQEEEDNLDAIAEQLLSRLDALDARLAALEQQISEHSHNGYATSEHNHQTAPTDAGPRATHWWFRRINR